MGRRPVLPPPFQFIFGDHQFQLACRDVDGNPISILDQGQQAAQSRLRADVADTWPSCRAGEPAIGHQRCGFGQPHTRHDGGNHLHLPHTGAAHRTFVTDDYDGTRLNAASFNCLNSVFHRVKYAGLPLVNPHFGRSRRFLDHRTFRGEIAPQYRQAAIGSDRVLQGVNDVGIVPHRSISHFADGLPAYRHSVRLQQISNGFENGGYPPGIVQIFDGVRTRGHDLGNIGCCPADFVDVMEIERCLNLLSQAQQVQDGVGGASDRHSDTERVFQGSGRDDIQRTQILLQYLHDPHSRLSRIAELGRRCGGHGGGGRQRHTQRFGQAGHGVSRPHHGTRPR